jgi:DUF2905 family protein
MEDMGKWLILLGVLIAIVGGVLWLVGKVPGLAHLPGDIVIQRDNFSCVFPLMTSILLSIILAVLLNLIFRLMNR